MHPYEEKPSETAIHRPDFAQPIQSVPELQAYDEEHMGGMSIYHNVWRDPSLPTDEEPYIDPSWLNDRPGEMAPDFLQVLRQGADEQLQRATPYPRAPFAAPDNTAASRRNTHQSQLVSGLEQGAQ